MNAGENSGTRGSRSTQCDAAAGSTSRWDVMAMAGWLVHEWDAAAEFGPLAGMRRWLRDFKSNSS